ncbi:4-hydroxy-2-oxo-heptane-1,7-dioate aldolase [Colletotrichum fructicola]|nr:4-hydroxy-2-oxo-heptane-1,7-dioate aldolase [Colletotrichum fructicola]
MQASSRLKMCFDKGQSSFGGWQMFPGANISRMLARTGVDWVLVDCEHGNIDDGAMHDAVPAIAALGVSPVVRLADLQGWMVKRALDSGAHAILVPLIRTVEEAKQLVREAKFPPQGIRGFGSLIALERFNPNPTLTEYLHQANDALLTIIQIETREAFDNVEGIAAVDGIDALFIGPFDLGNNIGHPVQNGVMPPELEDALDRILTAAHNAGKKCGIYCKDGAQAKHFASQGYDMVTAVTDYTALQRLSGIVCPGYENVKPLTWVAPNQITTRTWRGRKPAANKSIAPPKTNKPSEKKNTEPSKTAEEQLVHIFPGQELRTETCDIAEASFYWNNHVYPYFYDNQLTKSPWVVPASHIHAMKPYRRHGLVAMAIEHRMSQLSPTRNDPYAAEVRARAYHHRHTAIQALNEEIANETTRLSDATLAGVVTFIFGDLMGGATAPNWRIHLRGFAALVALRGGWEEFCLKSPHLKTLVLFCKIIENLANTTSPADDQVSPLDNYRIRDVIRDVFSIGYYPQLPCPIDLLIHIVHINRLRFLATLENTGSSIGPIQNEAEDVLDSILDFSPETWSNEMESSAEGFLLMGQIYQSAALLFGISSLQSAGAIPSSKEWVSLKKTHRDRLFALLDETTTSRALKICTTWPMIVAGFEAKGGSPWMRSFILDRLGEDSRQLGIYLPVAAKEVLEKFYASAAKHWDECFDSPRALFT